MKQIDVALTNKFIQKFSYTVENNIPISLTEWFSGWVEKYIDEQVEEVGEAAFKDKEFIRFGWSRLRVRLTEKMLILEAPDFRTFPVEWKKDLTIVLQIAVLHNQVPESFELTPQPTFLDDTVVVGEGFDRFPMFMSRTEQNEESTGRSGWFMASMSDDIDTSDTSNFHLISLYEAAVKAPHILEYLGMPEGTQVVFTSSKPKVLHNNQDLSVVKDHYQPV
ncbi:hypothetical protein MNBD_GAMMA12-3341 [hydrothermal vent metagenome]|uniref:Imm33-like domain-containing protein n=1 Tax=hydrothermal vent metagenome TaxID=652676 RepID=A0A3B0XYC2_9ZZZZ